MTAVIDATDRYVVLRPFTGLGRTLERGELVDGADWRNVQPLINTRYLATPWSVEGRAALPDDYEVVFELREPTVGEERDGDVPLLIDPPSRRPGRPRKEI